MKFHFVFPREVTFEEWDWRWPRLHGIGGSETSVVEMSGRLAGRGHQVTVWAPIPKDDGDHGWRNVDDLEMDDLKEDGVWVVYRYPLFFDYFQEVGKRTGQQLWLVAQDERYRTWDQEKDGTPVGDHRMELVDRVICLCQAHKEQTERMWPKLKGKVVQSSNGICSSAIREVIKEDGNQRNPNKLLYPSSPDRGLEFVLYVFERAREYNPDLELEVAYGFNNIDRIIQDNPNNVAPVARTNKEKMTGEMNRLGVKMMGRLPQPELWRRWLGTGIWCYPTTFKETSPVSGTTLVETVGGNFPIKDLVGKEFWVYSCDAKRNLAISKAKNVTCTRRNTKVIRLTFREGQGRNTNHQKQLVLTPDHEVLCIDGSYRAAGGLYVGDRVLVFSRDDAMSARPFRVHKKVVSSHILTKIESAGHEDVYCMEVEPDHNFVANGIFVHNCIVSMEAQALGAIPIVTPTWAVRENVRHGFLLPGDVRENPTVLSRFVGEVTRMSLNPQWQEEIRGPMMEWALRWFDWDNFVRQWEDLANGLEKPVQLYQSGADSLVK